MRTNLHALIRATALALCAVVLSMGVTGLCQPIMPMSAPVVETSAAPATYPATISWDKSPSASRYVVVTKDATNLTTATNIVVGFTPGTNIVSVAKAGSTWTGAPATLVWVGYPGAISIERVQRTISLAAPNWLDDPSTIRRVTNPPAGFFRYAATKHETLIGGPQ